MRKRVKERKEKGRKRERWEKEKVEREIEKNIDGKEFSWFREWKNLFWKMSFSYIETTVIKEQNPRRYTGLRIHAVLCFFNRV